MKEQSGVMREVVGAFRSRKFDGKVIYVLKCGHVAVFDDHVRMPKTKEIEMVCYRCALSVGS